MPTLTERLGIAYGTQKARLGTLLHVAKNKGLGPALRLGRQMAGENAKAVFDVSQVLGAATLQKTQELAGAFAQTLGEAGREVEQRLLGTARDQTERLLSDGNVFSALGIDLQSPQARYLIGMLGPQIVGVTGVSAIESLTAFADASLSKQAARKQVPTAKENELERLQQTPPVAVDPLTEAFSGIAQQALHAYIKGLERAGTEGIEGITPNEAHVLRQVAENLASLAWLTPQQQREEALKIAQQYAPDLRKKIT